MLQEQATSSLPSGSERSSSSAPLMEVKEGKSFTFFSFPAGLFPVGID